MNIIKKTLRSMFPRLAAWRNLYQDINKRYIIPKNRNKYKSCHESAILEMPFDISDYSKIEIAPYTKIRKGFKYLGYNGSFTIKKYSTIAMNCAVVPDGHQPVMGIPLIVSESNHINDKISDIIIDEGAWIGINCTLLPGTHIGRGAIVGAGSVVNKEIPPYAIAVGSPAKVIASAFTIDEILIHEEALYPEEERFSREELEAIFEKNFCGKKSIGYSTIPSEIKAEVQQQLSIMRAQIEHRR